MTKFRLHSVITCSYDSLSILLLAVGLLERRKLTELCVEKKNQLDATGWFIALIICSTCFGHFYAHHQELETMCVITAYGVHCLVAGCRGSGSGQQDVRPGRGMLHDVSLGLLLVGIELPETC